MSDTKEKTHTPGPWKVECNHNNKVIGVSGQGMEHDLDFVCAVSCKDDEANARLIAAAPELLAALERLGSMEAFNIAQVVSDTESDKELIMRVDFARSAIAKSKGGEG